MNMKPLLRAAFARRPLPSSISLPNDVRITHDRQGVPTVFARDQLGCAVGQGYVSALHRLWSMEQYRRLAAARMAEVAGPAMLDVDRWVCRLGLKEAVEAGFEQVQQDSATLAVLEAYSRGVNYFIEQTKDWGIEFALLNIHPELWSVKDCVRVLTIISWSLAGNWEEQLVRCSTLAALGPEQAALLEVDSWVSLEKSQYHRKELVKNVHAAFASLSGLLEQLPNWEHAKKQAGFLPRRAGSNAFVVGGEHTESGKPILAADPHLPPALPGFFYEVHLRSTEGNFNVAGAAVSGLPGVLSGRNQYYAWSITVAGAITAEPRIERSTDSFRQVRHQIKVKDQGEHIQEVTWGARGPLLSQFTAKESGPSQEEYSLSLEWVGHRGDDAGTLGAIWALNRAQSIEDMRSAAMRWGGPVLNLVWAETEREGGKYGWRVMGNVPLRRNPGEGLLPAPAWEAAGQWIEGYIPAEKLPEVISPPPGYIVSANHRLAPADYPYVLSHEYMSPYRAQRIEEMLQEDIDAAKEGNGRRYGVRDAQRIQTDQTSPSALALCRQITQAFRSTSEMTAAHPLAEQAIHLLRLWNGTLSRESAAGAIVKLTEDHYYRRVALHLAASTQDTTTVADHWIGVGHTPLNPSLMAHWRMREVLLNLMVTLPPEFQAITPQEWHTLLKEAFVAALDELAQTQGDIITLWRWGKVHQLELRHPLVQTPLGQPLPPAMRILRRLFRLTRGPFEMGGDEHTPWQTGSHPVPIDQATHEHRHEVNAYTPAWRMIAADGMRYYGCLLGGVSGHSTSQWSDNQLKDYLAGRLHTLSLTDE